MRCVASDVSRAAAAGRSGVKYHQHALLIYLCVDIMHHRCLHGGLTKIRRTPARAGVPGNELADEAAKLARGNLDGKLGMVVVRIKEGIGAPTQAYCLAAV
eukprot:scaffold41657_cov43-Prasinocladus_malaysianus.AAC.1